MFCFPILGPWPNELLVSYESWDLLRSLTWTGWKGPWHPADPYPNIFSWSFSWRKNKHLESRQISPKKIYEPTRLVSKWLDDSPDGSSHKDWILGLAAWMIKHVTLGPSLGTKTEFWKASTAYVSSLHMWFFFQNDDPLDLSLVDVEVHGGQTWARGWGALSFCLTHWLVDWVLRIPCDTVLYPFIFIHLHLSRDHKCKKLLAAYKQTTAFNTGQFTVHRWSLGCSKLEDQWRTKQRPLVQVNDSDLCRNLYYAWHWHCLATSCSDLISDLRSQIW